MMTDGEQNALGWTISTISGPLIFSFILGLVGQQRLALGFAFWAGVIFILWGMAWMGYAGGRSAQIRRNWKK